MNKQKVIIIRIKNVFNTSLSYFLKAENNLLDFKKKTPGQSTCESLKIFFIPFTFFIENRFFLIIYPEYGFSLPKLLTDPPHFSTYSNAHPFSLIRAQTGI